MIWFLWVSLNLRFRAYLHYLGTQIDTQMIVIGKHFLTTILLIGKHDEQSNSGSFGVRKESCAHERCVGAMKASVTYR